MKASPRLDDVFLDLENRLTSRIDTLSIKLNSERSVEEIEGEVVTLNELVNLFVQQDRRLEKLLDLTTPTEEFRQIVEQLSGSSRTVAEERESLKQLHSVSHQLIERSVQLFTKAHRLIDHSKNVTSRYAPEVCGFCSGFGCSEDSICQACKGSRTILVHQPALKCPRCMGTGRSDRAEPSVRCYRFCTVCGGSGWALRQPDRRKRE